MDPDSGTSRRRLPVLMSHEERRCSNLGPTQSRISPRVYLSIQRFSVVHGQSMSHLLYLAGIWNGGSGSGTSPQTLLWFRSFCMLSSEFGTNNTPHVKTAMSCRDPERRVRIRVPLRRLCYCFVVFCMTAVERIRHK